MNNGIEGDVQSRMDAFRGNPQALAQRYSQNQQLIDLLALQKLKSEKDAAARQMQMQAGQGQMPTVAQQREQELMGMAKQEVTQRVGAVGQQQAQQQQKNLQQAMQGGIAQAPAPNMMPPQAMASGGIVAFAGGGETAFTRGLKSAFSISPPSEDEAARRKRRETLAEIESEYESGPLQGALTLPSGEYDRRTAVRDYIRKNRNELISNPQLFSAFKANPDAFISGGMRTAAGQVTPAQTAPAPAQAQGIAQAAPSPAFAQQDQSYATKEARGIAPPAALPTGDFQGDPQQISSELAAISDPAERAAATAAFQRQMAAGNLAPQGQATQPAQAAQQAAQAISPVQAPLEKYLSGTLGAEPAAAGTEAEAAYAKRFDPYEQQRKELAQQGIAQLQQRMGQQPTQDPISAFLRGMSGQRTLGMALGAGGAGITAAQRANFEQRAALEDQLQKLREAELGAQVGQEKEKYGVGEGRRKEAVTAAEKAAGVAGPYLSREAQVAASIEIAKRDAVIREHNRELGLDAKISNMLLQRVKEANTLIANSKKYQFAHMDAKQAADMKAEMDASERKIYAEFGKTPPSVAAPVAPADANRPPLTSFKR